MAFAAVDFAATGFLATGALALEAAVDFAATGFLAAVAFAFDAAVDFAATGFLAAGAFAFDAAVVFAATGFLAAGAFTLAAVVFIAAVFLAVLALAAERLTAPACLMASALSPIKEPVEALLLRGVAEPGVPVDFAAVFTLDATLVVAFDDCALSALFLASSG